MPQPNHRAPLEELPDRLLAAVGDTLWMRREAIAALFALVVLLLLIRWIGSHYDEHGDVPTLPTLCAVSSLLYLLAFIL